MRRELVAVLIAVAFLGSGCTSDNPPPSGAVAEGDTDDGDLAVENKESTLDAGKCFQATNQRNREGMKIYCSGSELPAGVNGQPNSTSPFEGDPLRN